MQRKYIVVTGGVLSGLGKGIAMASIGNILSSSYEVVPIKCDGYLNVDPGTMNPIEHGEVFVLDDGGEVDMDFGHYERFLGVTCKSDSNLTMGRVFNDILNKERRGEFLGQTVQMVPHVSEFIQDYLVDKVEGSGADVGLIEIGGTVGDMENELYLHAVKHLPRRVGRENVVFAHLTYVPVLSGVNEQKSKPTQMAIAEMGQRGIEPDIIIARCESMLSDNVRGKIARSAGLNPEDVITGLDVNDVYDIPMVFERQGMSQLLARKLDIPVRADLGEWARLVENKRNFSGEVNVALAGKYMNLEDSYASIVEALNHCSAHYGTKINIDFIDTESGLDGIEKASGVIVPGGFGSRGLEGKIVAAKYCRENKVPYLGICLGLQTAVVEYARNVCGLEGANTVEVDAGTKYPVIDIMESQKDIKNKGGTMRLGSYEAVVEEGSKINKLYGSVDVRERHRHRFEVNPEYHDVLRDKGLRLSGMSPDGKLVEFVELDDHPYFVATQGHPELKSSLLAPAPLFRGFVEAFINYEGKK